MAPVYILNYFNYAARGEPVRIMFYLADVPFTDNQLSFAEWPSEKSDAKRFPLVQLPTLQVDDMVICQSKAIYRYLAHELDFNGETSADRAVGDMIMETLGYVFETASAIFFDFTMEADAKTKKMEDLFDGEKGKGHLKFVEDKVKSKKGEYLLGDKLTLADIDFMVTYQYLMVYYPETASRYQVFIS